MQAQCGSPQNTIPSFCSEDTDWYREEGYGDVAFSVDVITALSWATFLPFRYSQAKVLHGVFDCFPRVYIHSHSIRAAQQCWGLLGSVPSFLFLLRFCFIALADLELTPSTSSATSLCHHT